MFYMLYICIYNIKIYNITYMRNIIYSAEIKFSCYKNSYMYESNIFTTLFLNYMPKKHFIYKYYK